MASLVLKQIERGATSMGTSGLTVTVTLATTLTNTTKAVLLFSARSDSGSGTNYTVLGKIISTTQIVFERVAATIAVSIEYQVIEFTSGISVQHLVVTPTGNTTAVTITAVDLNKTFAFGTVKMSGTGFSVDKLALYDLTSTTNLNVVFNTYSGSSATAVQVVEIDDASVQKISTTFGTGTTKDITVTTIDAAKTFWFFGVTTTGALNCEQWPYVTYINTTTIRLTRVLTPGTDLPITIYVVSLSSGITVQNISTTIASGNTTVSPAITSVTVANTGMMINGIYNRCVSVNIADDEGAQGTVTIANLSATAFTATRPASAALASVTNVQILEFSTSGSSGSWFLLANQNPLFQGQNINGMR